MDIRTKLGQIRDRVRNMTTSKRWPNNAAYARDMAAEEMQETLRQLQLLISHKDNAIAAASGRAAYHTQRALRILEGQGASTRPIGQ